MTSLFRLFVRLVVNRGRLVSLGALGALAVLLGAAVGVATGVDRLDVGRRVVESYGLGLLVPVVALVLASAVLGDPAEDATLVYLWLRPVARWRTAVAAFAAALAAVVPLAVAPLVVAAALSRAGSALVGGAAAAAAVATVAYAAVFCGLGLRVRRALPWGLAYVLIWEGAVARVSTGAARFTVSAYARTLLARAVGAEAPAPEPATLTSVVVPLALAAAAVALTARWLARRDVA